MALAEWLYKIKFHSSLKLTPFQALYGYPPPQFGVQQAMGFGLQVVEEYMKDRGIMLQLLKDNLVQAQARMKLFADKKIIEREFNVGEMVYLRLQ